MTSYQLLGDSKSEVMGCRTPPPSSSWWARSSTSDKLVVVGCAIATSILVLGVGIHTSLCVMTKPETSHQNILAARSHRHVHTSISSTDALSATSSAAKISGNLPTIASAIPVATIASYVAPSVAVTSLIASIYSSAPSSTPTISASSSAPAISLSSNLPVPSGGLWLPSVKSSWQIVLNNPLNVNAQSTSVTPDVDVFDIDLFGNPKETFDALRRLGKKSICYFSAGSYEPGRPDSGDFQAADMGLGLDGWPGEFWLDLTSANVRQIMTKRIQLAASKGCDAIDPDNIDAYDNNNGLGMTQQNSIDYIQFLSLTAASYGISTGLKNAASIVSSVLDSIHFSVNEECAQYGECSSFDCVIGAGKPVFHIEYPNEVASLGFTPASLCASAPGFSTVLKNLSLDGYVQECLSGVVANTAVLA